MDYVKRFRFIIVTPFFGVGQQRRPAVPTGFPQEREGKGCPWEVKVMLAAYGNSGGSTGGGGISYGPVFWVIVAVIVVVVLALVALRTRRSRTKRSRSTSGLAQQDTTDRAA